MQHGRLPDTLHFLLCGGELRRVMMVRRTNLAYNLRLDTQRMLGTG